MSDDIGRGFREAIKGVLEGAIVSAILGVIPLLPNIPSYFAGIISLFQISALVASIAVIQKFESWHIGYLIGWLLAAWIMSYAGLVESWLVPIYLVVGAITLATRFSRIIDRFLGKY